MARRRIEANDSTLPDGGPDSSQLHSLKRTPPCRSINTMLEQRVPYPGARMKALDSSRSHSRLTPVRGSSALVGLALIAQQLEQRLLIRQAAPSLR